MMGRLSIKFFIYHLAFITITILGATELLIATAHAATFEVDKMSKSTSVRAYIGYYRDDSEALTLGDILQDKQSLVFDSLGSVSMNFDLTESPYWLRFNAANAGEKRITSLLEIAYPLLDEVTVFIVPTAGPIQTFLLGEDLGFDNRPVQHRNFVVPIELESRSEA